MHYAVASNNVNKINELLSEDIDFDTNSSTNKIPTHSLICKGKDDVDIYKNIVDIKIPYCEHGYTPFHLNVFLHSYYKKRTHLDYRQVAGMQESMFYSFLSKYPKMMFCEDSAGLTITDYCILSLNFDYLKQIKDKDNYLESLHKVEAMTAKKIFENEIALNTPHKNNHVTTEDLKFMSEMVNFFNSKHTKDKLNKDLDSKEEEKSGKIKI